MGYGSSEIIDFNRQPDISVLSGSDAQAQVVISNGTIVEVLILNGGSNYTSIPDLDLNGDGYGAVLTPIMENGSLSSVKIIAGGAQYTSAGTSLTILPAGSGVKFNANIQSWRVNLFTKYLSSFNISDGFITNGVNDEYGLQFFSLYVPRKLRENIFAVDQSGEVLYGDKDLKKVAGIEVDSDEHSPIIGWAYDLSLIHI